MVLTNQEMDSVLGYIRKEIVLVQQINADIRKTINSEILQKKPNFDEDSTKKEHAKNIVQAIRFLITEQGITQIPPAFTRQEMIDKGVLE